VVDEVKAPERRPYRSAVREDAARRTRRAIVSAAAELFGVHGYAGTSLAAIAAASGVARPTVFAAFGSKAALLRQVVDQALAGDDEPVPVASRPWFAPVWQARTPAAVLDAYATVCTLIGERAAAVFETVRRAADDGPEAAVLWQTLEENRRAGARMVLEHARGTGDLRPGLDAERAVDVLWFWNDPAHYGALVGTRNWTAGEYRDWLSARMRESLVGPPPPQRPRRPAEDG
jgi:AcrR family transcriptional regulator